MISFEDCAALSGLSRKELDAIAEHEQVPEMAAAALASYLLQRRGGKDEIRRMFVEDIRKAIDENRSRHAAELFGALRQFISQHQLQEK